MEKNILTRMTFYIYGCIAHTSVRMKHIGLRLTKSSLMGKCVLQS